jgi:hypothetical protein
MYLQPSTKLAATRESTNEQSNPIVTDKGANPLCLPRDFAGANSEMYIVHMDVAMPTESPATNRPKTTCSIAHAVAMSAAETMNPTSQHASANRRPSGSFNPGVAAHPNVAPNGSAATTAPLAVVVNVPRTVPASMYTNAPAIAPHAHPTLSIARHTDSVATYCARSPSAGVASANNSETNDDVVVARRETRVARDDVDDDEEDDDIFVHRARASQSSRVVLILVLVKISARPLRRRGGDADAVATVVRARNASRDDAVATRGGGANENARMFARLSSTRRDGARVGVRVTVRYPSVWKRVFLKTKRRRRREAARERERHDARG